MTAEPFQGDTAIFGEDVPRLSRTVIAARLAILTPAEAERRWYGATRLPVLLSVPVAATPPASNDTANFSEGVRQGAEGRQAIVDSANRTFVELHGEAYKSALQAFSQGHRSGWRNGFQWGSLSAGLLTGLVTALALHLFPAIKALLS